VQSEKKGLFVGRGPYANEGLRKTQGVSWVAKASLGVVPTTPDAQDVARQDDAARA
jgi:hypothetical protein